MMKQLLAYSLVILLTVCSCGKSVLEKKSPGEISLLGKWTYKEHFFSPGGMGAWHPVVPANQSIEFKKDGSFVPSGSFLPEANKYEITDSVTIKFQPAATSNGYILMGYKIDTANETLYLYPVNPICIEGCNNKFMR